MIRTIKTDIAVVGAGIAGISAAISAAREGCKVILIEAFSYVGGMATGALVSPFMKHDIKGKPLVEGVFRDLKVQMRAKGGMLDNGFSDTVFKEVAMAMLKEAGVEIFLNTSLIEVESDVTKIN